MAPCKPVAPFCAFHKEFDRRVLPRPGVLDLVADTPADVCVVEAHLLPQRDAAVRLRFFVSALRGKSFCQILRVHHADRAHIRCRLQQRHTQVRSHGRHLVVGEHLLRKALPAAALVYAVQVLDERREILVGIHAVCLFDRPLNRRREHVPVFKLLLFTVVVPLHRVEDRQRQCVILRHVRHVV